MRTIRTIGYVALFVGFAQVVFGAIVRISGSGMGCGDHWPDCYGAFTPTHGTPTLAVEISHRYGAVALSIAIVALVGLAWSRRKVVGVGGAGGVLRAAVLALALVVVAALFGALTVKLSLNPIVVVTHLAIAMALLAALVVVVVRAGGFGSRSVPARYARTVRSGRAAAAITFLALVFGALTANTPGAAAACQGFPLCRVIAEHGAPLLIQVTHRIIALLLLGHLIGVTVGVRRRAETRAVLAAASITLGLVVAQVLIAAAMVEMGLPATLRSLHQAAGTALWIAVVALTALAAGTAESTDIERIIFESPSRGKFATPEGVST